MLLLDEADVFMRQRSLDHASNTHITIFLRKLEYYEGIMFLTTNRVKDFDDAMQSRIHLAVKYPDLGVDTRRSIWASFLDKAVTAGGEAKLKQKELNMLAEKVLNGRQVCYSSCPTEESCANPSVTVDQKRCKSSPRLSISR